jgi:glycosyltransferase involved in cell wall biosynthesis
MDSTLKANPRVSVVIPTYNRAHLVSRSIQSVLSQTYQDFEVIVVDDGSTDNTSEAVNSIGDERVNYIRHDVNKGASASRNTGIRAARGELIGFLDSDDEWLPQKLQKQVDRFDIASPNVGLVYGGYVVIDDETKKAIGQVHPEKRGYVFKEVLKASHPPSPLTPLVKRECFEKVGLFDEDIRFGEDWDMWLRIAEHYEFDFVDEMVAKYHVSRHQVTRDRVSALEELSKFRAKHQRQLSENPAILAHQLKWIGQRYLLDGEYAAARGYLVQAVRANPRGVRLYIHLLAAYTVPSVYRAVLKSQLVYSLRKHLAWFGKVTRVR